ncbi:MAG: hypothetical protein RL133_1162, partial [Pseudomonadota bacterium]
MALALAFGLLYSLPNLFGEAPAVQVSSAKATVKIQSSLVETVEGALKAANIESTAIGFETNNTGNTVRARFANTDTQLLAKDAIEKALNGGSAPEDARYVVALNL